MNIPDELTVTEEKIISAFRQGQKENFQHSVLHLTRFNIERLDDDKLYVVLVDMRTNEIIKKINLMKFLIVNKSEELFEFLKRQLEEGKTE